MSVQHFIGDRSLLLLLGISSILVGLFACAPKIQSRYLSAADIQRLPEAYDIAGTRVIERSSYSACEDPANYIPDTNHLDHIPTKYIRVNFHYMNTADSSSNYYGEEAIRFSKGLIRAANQDLGKNQRMWLPYGNDTPALPVRHRLVLTPRPGDPQDEGVYWHFDDELYFYVVRGKDRNLHKRDVINQYGVQLDTVLNIFIMPPHPDSLASSTYFATGTGVALGSAIKLSWKIQPDPGDSFWARRGLINHEVGHIFGLSHTWAYDDGCDDTPKHEQNCWGKNDRPECDSLASNNVMDYNAKQTAWSPCQLGKVLQRMANPIARQRQLLVPNWCELHADRHIYIRDTVVWNGMRDLEGHLTIAPGGSLTITCRVALPAGAKITVEPGGTLILDGARLHNACGGQWQGIEIQEAGNRKGTVVYLADPMLEDVVNGVDG